MTVCLGLSALLLWDSTSSAQINFGTNYGLQTASSIVDGDVPASLTVVGKEELEFPLKHTEVDATITGFVAEVEVRQEYYNPFTDVIEAIYVFPLPHDGAVYEMQMIIGEKVIKGEIKTREEAQEIYEYAKEQGQVASLLEQERPNIFTQSVANILPGEQIDIVIKYTETLDFEDNNYEFVFPMVVGPRYIPGNYVEGYFNPSIDDADRITPPVLPEGMRSGHDINLSLSLNTGGIPITDISSAQHEIIKTQTQGNKAIISLKEGDTIPNKDFILRYSLDSDEPQFGFFSYAPPGEDGYFTLIAQPQSEYTVTEVTPKEIFYIVDTSGSMGGEPIKKVKDAMTYALQNLNPEDSFYFMTFSNVVQRLSKEPLPNTPGNIMRGLEFVDAIESGGGTEMLPGLVEALQYPNSQNRLRIIALMSDGYIGNESEVLGAVQEHLGDQTRLFSFGIGSSMNRYLMDEFGELGRGGVYYVTLGDESAKVVEEFYERIGSPLLTDLVIDWGGVEVTELYPTLYPDLFGGQPIYVFGRYKKSANTEIKITGRQGLIEEGLGNDIMKLITGDASVQRTEELFSLTANFTANNTDNEWIGRMWARNKIDELMDHLNPKAYFYGANRYDDSTVESQITELGLQYGLVTNYTSFVAVSEEVVVEPGQTPITIEVPLELPEGTEYEGFFGSSDKSLPNPMDSGLISQSVGATFGLGTANLESTTLEMMKWIGIAFAVILLFAILIGKIYLRYRKKKQKITNTLHKVLAYVISFVAVVGVLFGLIFLVMASNNGDEAVSWVMDNILVYYGALLVLLLVLLGLWKKVGWKKVMYLSIFILIFYYAWQAVIAALTIAEYPDILSGASWIYVLQYIWPFVITAIYIILLIGLLKKFRCAYLTLWVLVVLTLLQYVFSGPWPLWVYGYDIVVIPLLVSLIVLRKQLWHKELSAQNE